MKTDLKTPLLTDYLSGVQHAISEIDVDGLKKLGTLFLDCLDRDGTIFTFGNGGSGATASHFAGDILKGLSYPGQKRFKSVCLNDNAPGMMAIANDISYDDIFVEPLKNWARHGDLVMGFSGSGNSENVVRALAYANTISAHSVAICGFDGGKIKTIGQTVIHVPVHDMEMAEDAHMIVCHAVKKVLMDVLSKKKAYQ